MDNLTTNNLLVILDVLNVYNADDIKDVYPQMAEQEFLDEVQETFKKVLEIIVDRPTKN